MEKWKTNTAVFLTFFVRDYTLKEVFKKIQQARPKTLFLVCDGPRKGNDEDRVGQERCKKIVENITWECDVHKVYSKENRGIMTNTYEGLKYAFEYVDRLIFLEDDIVVSNSFFEFCDVLLEKYKDDLRIQLINGMNHLGIYSVGDQNYFFSEIGSIWGIAMWKRTFENIENNLQYIDDEYTFGLLCQRLPSFQKSLYLSKGKKYRKQYIKDSKIRSFEISLYVSGYLHNQMQIVPTKNMVTSIGLGQGSANAPNELKMLPHRIQKLFFAPIYEINKPFIPPQYEIPDINYEKKLDFIMGRNSIIAKGLYFIEQLFLKLRYGGLIKAIKKRVEEKI